MILFVCCIHNNMLGACHSVSSYEDGAKMIKQLAQEQLGRPLEDDELKDLESYYFVFNDEDMDNTYCWSIGIVE